MMAPRLFIQNIVKITIFFAISLNVLAQAPEEKSLEYYKKTKPYFLDIRFCACKALDMNPDVLEPLPSFLNEANTIKVGVDKNDSGYVAAGGMAFGYSIKPDKESNAFLLSYSENYSDAGGTNSSQSEIVMGTNSWVVISGYENTTEAETDYFYVAVKIIINERFKTP